MVFNPYTVVYVDRTSVTLLGIAALPWLMLAVHRGLREPRRWWWPAALALLVTAAGAGVNAAVTAWVLVGPWRWRCTSGRSARCVEGPARVRAAGRWRWGSPPRPGGWGRC